MQYVRTPVRRLVNTLETARIRLGIAPRHRYLLTVAGRGTGQPHTTPVGLVEHGSERWLVAPYGEVAWVRNARAAGVVRLGRGRRVELLSITEADPTVAGAVLKAYAALEPITRPFFEASPAAPAAAYAAEAARHPVFRLAVADGRAG